MPTFHVKDTFEIPTRKLFVMAGTILNGKIQAGMFVRVRCNSELDMKVRIHSIEFALRKNGEDVCLCIEADPKLAQLLRGLNIANQTVDVVLEVDKKR